MSEENKRPSGSDALIIKWGHEAYDDGIMNLPSCVGMYGRRFLNGGEFSFIICLMAYKFTSDNPFPSQERVAKNMGVSIKTVENWVSSLYNDKELLEIYYRYDEKGNRTSNEYNFGPLLEKCLEEARKEKAAKTQDTNKRKRKPKKKKSENTTPKNIGVATPKNLGIVSEKTSVTNPKNIGANKVIESSNINKEIKNNLSMYENEINNANLPVTTRNVLLKNIDRLIDNNITVLDVFDNYELNKEFVNVAQYNSALKFAFNLKNFTDSFEDVMATNVKKQLEFANENAGTKGKRKPVRKEMVPDWHGKSNEENKAEAKAHENMSDEEFEIEKLKLQAELDALTSELKQKGQEQPV